MFFRIKTSKSGCVLQLVESYRNEENLPRQRLVVSLGEAALPREYWREVANRVEARLGQRGEQHQLREAEDAAELAKWVTTVVNRIQREDKWLARREATTIPAETIDGVKSAEVSHASTAVLGPALLGSHAWEALGMDDQLAGLGFNDSQRACAAALVINRLCDPVSEHALGDWITTSALPDLIGEELSLAGKDRFYRAGDKLFAARQALEAHLRERQASLFNLNRTLLLYDLTNTHFEGVCAANPKAKRGQNKQKRNDCPQVVIGMIFDEHGFALNHQVFEGNLHDGKSLLRIINTLGTLAQSEDTLAAETPPIVVMDSGVATEANRRLLREHNLAYIVSHSRPGRHQWQGEFATGAFTTIPGREGKPDVQIRTLDVEFTDQDEETGEAISYTERLLLCKSAGRKAKEAAIHSKAEDRLLADLEKLRIRVGKGNLKDPAKVQQAFGRLRQRHSRVARYYDLDDTQDLEHPEQRIHWRRRTDAHEANTDLHGCYVLRSYRQDLSGEQIWQLYITLTQAEAAFRSLKSDLGLRPNFHQKEERVESHIFITILAYHLLRYLLFTLAQSGDHRQWPTLRRILSTHCYSTITLPTLAGAIHHLRMPGTPDAAQQQIYAAFDLDLSSLPTTHLELPKT